MILYHGSNVVVEKPRIITSNKNLDFGAGFYLTSDIEQAKSWSMSKTRRRGKGTPATSVFEFDDAYAEGTLNMKKFIKPDLEWLNFVADNRKGRYAGTLFDIVFGPVADDWTVVTINDYVSGVMPAETALALLEPRKLTDQYAFLTHRGLGTLKFREVILNHG